MNTFPKINRIENRPGLGALNYRLGDYHWFYRFLLSQLAQQQPLSPLTYRERDDAAIALLDSWAVVADVLTFYQERIANEGYLRTATERFSIIELARALGYELAPGVAASTYLAFTLEEEPDSPPQVTLPKGTQVMSVPDPGELPQTFETREDAIARPEWNAIAPRLSRPQVVTSQTRRLYLEGIAVQLTPGDPLLLIDVGYPGDDRRYLLTLETVEVLADANQTLITWEQPFSREPNLTLRNPQVFAFRLQGNLFGFNAPRWDSVPNQIKRESGATPTGGVFQAAIATDSNPIDPQEIVWEVASQGLPNQDILCLATQDKSLFAGTAGRGIFRSQDGGKTWTAGITGLTNLHISTLYGDGDRLYAGTPGGGVFCSKDKGETWNPINLGSVRIEKLNNADPAKPIVTGIPNTVVRSLLSYEIGSTHYIFAGTDESIYRTTNQGQDWSSEKIPTGINSSPPREYKHLQGLANHVIFSLLYLPQEPKNVTGRIDNIISDTEITVRNVSNGYLEKGDAITAEKETRLVVGVKYTLEVEIIVGAVDLSDVEAGSSFRISDKEIAGEIEEIELVRIIGVNQLWIIKLNLDTRGNLEGSDTIVITALNSNRIIEIEDNQYTITEEIFTINQDFTSEEIKSGTNVQATFIKIFAGTDRGVYGSPDHGETWTLINLKTKAIYALIADSNQNIFAGTDKGVFQYKNDGSDFLELEELNQAVQSLAIEGESIFAATELGILVWENNQWQGINGDLEITNVTALDIPLKNQNATPQNHLKQLFAATRFSGFAEDNTEKVGYEASAPTGEWKDFQLAEHQIDLDTLYPKILPDSWVALSDRRENSASEAAIVRIESASTVQRKDFTLDAKITRIIPDKTIDNPAQFGLRTTIVLAQSEALELAREPLTVSFQQTKIFLDPLKGKEIYLQQFVPHLKLQQTLLISGKFIRANANLGGIFRSKNWEQPSKDLIEETVQALAIDANGHYIAGTKNGIFRSTDGGNSWEALNEGLESKNVTALLAYVKKLKDGLAASGNLVEGPHPIPSPPTIEASPTAASAAQLASSTLFTTELRVGDLIKITKIPRLVKNPIRVVKEILSERKLIIDVAYPEDLVAGTAWEIPKLLAATDTGIFRFNYLNEIWEKISEEPTDVTVMDFNSDNGDIFAGVAGKTVKGVFVYQTDEETGEKTWKQILKGVEVQALAVNLANKYIFVGTSEKGIYRSLNNGKTWKQVGYTRLGRGTISSDDWTVTGTEIAFKRELKEGDTIAAAGQTRIINQIFSDAELDDTQLKINTPFNPNLPEGTTFTVSSGLTDLEVTAIAIHTQSDEATISSQGDIVTGKGIAFTKILQEEDILLAKNQIKTVKAIYSDTQLTIDSSFNPKLKDEYFLIPNRGQGTISSQDKTITGVGTKFIRTFRPGDTIIVGNQIKIVDTVISETELKVKQAFSPELQSETPFFVADRGKGKITSDGTSVTGQDIAFTQEINQGDCIIIGDQIRTVTEVTDNSLTIDADLDVSSTQPFSILSKTYLVAGTDGGGVFRSTNNGQNWKPIKTNLQEQEIRSLAISPKEGYIFAGTAKSGVFRSTNRGNLWDVFEAGLSDRTILALGGTEEVLLAGTEAGVFQVLPNEDTEAGHVPWEHSTDGLTYTSVQDLAVDRLTGTLYAGTQQGVFHSPDWGRTWEAAKTGLGNDNVQALAYWQGRLFAGTLEGLFVSGDEGRKWEPVNVGVVRPNVQAITLHQDSLFLGTLDSGILRSTDTVGESWTFAGLNQQDIRVFQSVGEELWVGTAGKGIFFSDNNGFSWQSIDNKRPGTGKLSSKEATVQGDDTQFFTDLVVGDRLIANGQTVTVVAIASDEELTVEQAFNPPLEAETFEIETGLSNLYITALAVDLRKGAGTISSLETAVIGEETKFTQELAVGDFIRVGDLQATVTQIVSDVELRIDRAFNDLPSGTFYYIDTFYAGTAGSGVFRSRNRGKRWQAINQGELAEHLEIRCLTVDSAQGNLLVGTALGGVFRSADQGESWQPLKTGLTSTDVRVIRIENSNILVGGIGIAIAADGFQSVEVEPNDLLYVTAAPENGIWKVRCRNQFDGEVQLAHPQDITLYPATEDDPLISERCVIARPPDDERQPVLRLADALQYSYDPASVIIYGNVAEATHGKTIGPEVLGSGNSAIPNQKFALQKPPLTYTAAATATGGESTLEVEVNEVQWTEVNSLYSESDRAQSYLIRIEDDGTTQIVFGDGKRGARLPSGQDNIVVTYRTGIGTAGEVGANRLTLPKTGPPNLLEVTNPLAATGAAEGESLDQARHNAPASVRTLERIVSLQDFEDFASTFAGIGKAQAVALSLSSQELVHLTVAGCNGKAVEPTSALYQSLVKAIDAARDPISRIQVDSYQPLYFKIEAKVLIDSRYQSERVLEAIREKILESFAFERRQFGQLVTSAEIISAIHAVAGVTSVDLDALHRRDRSRTLQKELPAATAKVCRDLETQVRQILPAQLLLISLDDIILNSVSTL